VDNNDIQKYDLSRDEFLSIYFYTLEWKPEPTQNTYLRLNAALTSQDRDLKCTKWRFYLHHLFNALRKIPKWKHTHDLYRGVQGDLTKKYPGKYEKGKQITWYGFTSATTEFGVITNFLPQNQTITVFALNVIFSGRSVNHFSAIPNESEILIPPGSRFEVVSVGNMPQVVLIQLKQIPTMEKLLNME